MENCIVFSLQSNQAAAEKVAKKFNAELGVISIDNFADGEVLVKSLSDVKNKDVIIIESTAKNAHEILFELLLLIDSVKRSGAKTVKLFIPYFGYSRQERVSWFNEPVSCEVVAKILDTAEVDEILTFDLHHKDIENFFKTKFTNLPTTKLFSNYYKNYFSTHRINLDDVVIVSPDHGSNTRADFLVEELKGTKKVILNKYRPKPNLAEHLEVDVKEVKDKICIIVDDIIDTGGTIISAADLLVRSGAKSVLVAASHGVFSPNSINKLMESPLDDIVVTNSIEKRLPKRINIVDISELIEL
jgi:ribose-phosphate pyrophosphokinase